MSSRSRPRAGAGFASRPEIRKMLWHFHGFNARSLPLGINPPLHAQCAPYGNLAKLYPLRGGEVLSEQARRVSGWISAVLVFAEMFTQMVPASGEPGFYPSGCGGHKNSENTDTFSKILGREDKLSPHGQISVIQGARPEKDTRETC